MICRRFMLLQYFTTNTITRRSIFLDSLASIVARSQEKCRPFSLSPILTSYRALSLSLRGLIRYTYTSSTNLSHHRLPSSLRTDSTDFTTGPFLLSISVLCLFQFLHYSFLFGSVRQTTQLLVSFWAHVNIVAYRIVSYTVQKPRKGKERKIIYIVPFIVRISSKRSDMDHTVLPANYTDLCSQNLGLCMIQA